MTRIRNLLNAIRWPMSAIFAILMVVYTYSLLWTAAISFGPVKSEWNHDMVQGWLICCSPSTGKKQALASVHDTYFVSNVSFQGISRFGLGIPLRFSLGSVQVTAIPLGSLLLFTGMFSVATWVARRRSIPAGSCVRCGYNLTGNVSGVCPECGAVVESCGGKQAG